MIFFYHFIFFFFWENLPLQLNIPSLFFLYYFLFSLSLSSSLSLSLSLNQDEQSDQIFQIPTTQRPWSLLDTHCPATMITTHHRKINSLRPTKLIAQPPWSQPNPHHCYQTQQPKNANQSTTLNPTSLRSNKVRIAQKRTKKRKKIIRYQWYRLTSPRERECIKDLWVSGVED